MWYDFGNDYRRWYLIFSLKFTDSIQREIISSGFLALDLVWIIEELYKMLVDVESCVDDENTSYDDFQEIVADLLKTYCVLVTLLSVNGIFLD